MIDKAVSATESELEASAAAGERRVSVALISLQKAEVSGPGAKKPGRMNLAGKAALLRGLTGAGGSEAAGDATGGCCTATAVFSGTVVCSTRVLFVKLQMGPLMVAPQPGS